jgi:hypothetical protein
MEVTITCARVYASDDKYGETPRERPAGAPLRFSDFPAVGEAVTIDLGPVPDEIVEADRMRRGIGGAMLSVLGGGEEGLTFQERVDRALSDGAADDALEQREWYATVTLSRVVEVPDELVTDTDFAFVHPKSGLADEIVAYAKPHLDAVVTMTSTIIDPRVFAEVVLDDRVLIFIEGKRPGGFPVMRGSANLSVTRGGESVDQLQRQIELLRGSDLAELARSGLASVAHWRVQALQETDPWKRFSWTFLGLEMLTHKLSGRLRQPFLDRLAFKDSREQPVDHDLPLDEVVWRSERMPLKAKFALVASILFPESAREDTETFGELKDARDGVAHGTVRSESELPTSACETLFEKYLAGALKHVIFGMSASTAWEDVHET